MADDQSPNGGGGEEWPEWAQSILYGIKDPAAEYRLIRKITSDRVAKEDPKDCYKAAIDNSKKNRYMDVLPYEHTRVKLKECERVNGEENGQMDKNCEDCLCDGDYINASSLDGLLGYHYVATQAPLPGTVADFWQMVWEQKTLTVVMLTRIVEASKTKAMRYWPPQIGDCIKLSNTFSIILRSEKIHPSHQICARTIEMRKCTYGKDPEVPEKTFSRLITHLHYTEWPDYGLPSSTDGIRTLVHLTDALIRDQQLQKTVGLDSSLTDEKLPPIVVHCSAGIGRAGTFIAVHQTVKQIESKIEEDMMKEQKKEFEPVLGDVTKIMDTVLSMREQRRGMVQTKEQYCFIYRVAEDALNALLKNSPLLGESWRSEGLAAAEFLKEDDAEDPADHVFLRKTNTNIPVPQPDSASSTLASYAICGSQEYARNGDDGDEDDDDMYDDDDEIIYSSVVDDDDCKYDD